MDTGEPPADEIAAPEPTLSRIVKVPAGEDTVSFGGRRGSMLLTLLLAVAALAASGATLYLSYADEIATRTGIACSAVALVLVVMLVRHRSGGTSVWIDRGVLHVIDGDGSHRFDLASDQVRLAMLGTPGQRGWRIQFLRRGMGPFEITSAMVDSVQLTEALRRWRPTL